MTADFGNFLPNDQDMQWTWQKELYILNFVDKNYNHEITHLLTCLNV